MAMTSLRVEKGYRAWGHDLTPDDTPLEAGLEFAVKLDKTSTFKGRDALLRQRDQGVGRRFMFLTLKDPQVLAHGGEPIVVDGRYRGQVSSCAFGHSVGCTVAMGYVRLEGDPPRDLVENGRFELEIAGERHPCTPSLAPPYDPRGERLRA